MTKQELKKVFYSSGDYSWVVKGNLKDGKGYATSSINKDGLVGEKYKEISDIEDWAVVEIFKYQNLSISDLTNKFYKSGDYKWQIEARDYKDTLLLSTQIYRDRTFSISPELALQYWIVVEVEKDNPYIYSKEQKIEDLTRKVDLLLEEVKKLK